MTSFKSSGHRSSLPVVAVALSGSASMRKLRQEAGQATVLDPATTLIRFPDVIAMTGLARATIYKRLKDDPTFPRPVPLSDSMSRGAPVGFVLAEVQRWTCARIEVREASA